MSDTSDVAVRRFRRDSPTVDAVCRQLESQVSPEEAPLVVALAEIFFSKAPADLLQERSTDNLAHIALGAFRFLERSRPDRVDVEVLNPDIDNEGWYAPVTVIRTNLSERPFIVDTIREFLHSQGLPIEHYVYPGMHVDRGEDGSIQAIRPSHQREGRESLVHCEVPRVTDRALMDVLESEVSRSLHDVMRATDDFHRMVDALNDVVAELAELARELPQRRDQLEEIQEFLRWLRDGAFVFLGYRGYDLLEREGGESVVKVTPGSGLGILGDESESAYAVGVNVSELGEGLREVLEGGPDLIISKTNAEATVHRRARMDYVGVRKLGVDGRVRGEHRFIGLFTSRAYGEEAERIPILREKLKLILEDEGVLEGSHDYKEINTIFNSMPKEELFLTSAGEIGADIRTVLTSYHTEDVRVTLRQDPLRRGVAAMVILPKEKFSGDVRRDIERALVGALDGEVLNYHLALGAGDQARLHFHVGAPLQPLPPSRAVELERTVRALIRSWTERLQEELEEIRPRDEARRLARRYGEDFSAEYRAATDPNRAVQDVLELEAMAAESRTIGVAFSNRAGSVAAPDVPDLTELKLYLRSSRLILSDFMPILENCGLRVIAVNPFDVSDSGDSWAVIYAFAVQSRAGEQVDVGARGTLLGHTILAAWCGDVSSDALNALVLAAGLHWREVDVLRAFAAYAFQVRAVPSRQSLPSALVNHPHVARILFELFEIKFDPNRTLPVHERREAADDVLALLVEAFGGVALLADDRALRALTSLVHATVRTNYYSCGGRQAVKRSGGVPYVSLKIASRQTEVLSRSKLLYEVWVRSSCMEAVHLRGAAVARGGIRWSDRPDDFRAEVLGLVKTQMVKNAVIVPAGSKGGFVTLRSPADPAKRAEDGKEQYRTLIRGLLDITDNLDSEGLDVARDGVVRFDEPDPYLVVAADKGTALYSDVANDVAAEYDFWLGDALASGGSNGYDHKAVGITARGAWECVKRHFRERGKDILADPFTVVGIGDMSGDVFGNGMLLSEKIRLVAAFDHRHVFIDPTPDEASSFEERKRLFELTGSTWDDYDREKLSAGGMIVPRGAKEVTLGAEAKVALGWPADDEPLDGERLVRAVLKAPVELLWNGGIGTYVKASDERDSDVGDPSNDAVRVDAPELRCEVVGEGGNLGFTQLARIEYAMSGGRINTDAIDNSGGVDLSDREVNLKILLDAAIQSGRVEQRRRNELLVELTDSVAQLVLEDSRSQSMAISLDEIRVHSPENADDFRDLMSGLEKAGVLDRTTEHLPGMEALVERRERGQDLLRPELCVLLAYAKLSVRGQVLDSSLPDDPAAQSYLLGYFPPAAYAEAGPDTLSGHRLRRPIIASQVTNDIVDLMGSTFVHRLTRDTGRTTTEVVRAWLISSRLAGHRTLLRRVLDEAAAPVTAAYRWLLGLSRVLQRTTRWVLNNVQPEIPTADVIEENLEGLVALRRAFPGIVVGQEQQTFNRLVKEVQKGGVKKDFAQGLMTLRFLDQLLEVLRIAKETRADPVETARAFYHVSDLLSVSWLRQALLDAAEEDRWEQRAAQDLGDDLGRAHHLVVARVMRSFSVGSDIDVVGRYRALLDEIRQEHTISLSGLSVAVREITTVAHELDDGPK